MAEKEDTPDFNIDNVWPLDETDISFYFDCVAHMLGSDYKSLGIELDLSEAKLDTLKHHNKGNLHELCFDVLWSWYQSTTKNCRDILYEALKSCGRQDILQKSFNRMKYNYKEDIVQPDSPLEQYDLHKLSEHIPSTFQRLGRYFSLKQNRIYQLITDHPDDTREQAYQVLLICHRSRKIRSRRHLFDALIYIDNAQACHELNKIWTEKLRQ